MGPSPSAALHHAGMACILKPCVNFASHASRTNRPCDKMLARGGGLRFDQAPRRPPLQAAAIILPTVLAQDALTVWTYRREWSPWNLMIMIPSMAAGIAVAGLFAAALTAAH